MQSLQSQSLVVGLDFTDAGDDVLIGSAQWVRPDDIRERRSIVLTLRDGMIADMQVCASPRQAKRFARRLAHA